MNIFVLDKDPVKAAEYHCDKHVVKMVLEGAQVLGSTLWHNNRITSKKKLLESSRAFKANIWRGFPRVDSSGNVQPYGIGFINHPCTKWARESKENWEWLCNLSMHLTYQHEKRYGKVTAMRDRIQWFIDNPPTLPSKGLTPFYQAVPPEIKSVDAIHAYRMYYASHKPYFAKWKNETPYWWNSYVIVSKLRNTVEKRSVDAVHQLLGNRSKKQLKKELCLVTATI